MGFQGDTWCSPKGEWAKGSCGRRENGQSDCSSLSPWCLCTNAHGRVCVRSPFALDAHVASCFDDIKGISPNISCAEEPRTTYSSPSFHPFPPNASPSLPSFHLLTLLFLPSPLPPFPRFTVETNTANTYTHIYIYTHAGRSVIEREQEERSQRWGRWKMEDEDGNWRPLKPAAFPAIRTPHGSENLLS